MAISAGGGSTTGHDVRGPRRPSARWAVVSRPLDKQRAGAPQDPHSRATRGARSGRSDRRGHAVHSAARLGLSRRRPNPTRQCSARSVVEVPKSSECNTPGKTPRRFSGVPISDVNSSSNCGNGTSGRKPTTAARPLCARTRAAHVCWRVAARERANVRQASTRPSTQARRHGASRPRRRAGRLGPVHVDR